MEETRTQAAQAVAAGHATVEEQVRLRRSIGRALAFLMPGLGHAFHGSFVFAIAYLVGFVYVMYQAWGALADPYGAPVLPAWLILATAIWLGQFLHVSYMALNDTDQD